MKNRDMVQRISARIAEENPLIQVIIGPRQVGKTTALKAALQNRGIYETADYPTPLPFEVIETWWAKAQRSPDRLLAIDEVQKIRGWTEVVKRLWDRNPREIKLILTGSSALHMEKGLKETLAGRYELIRAGHWSFKEAKKIFNLNLMEFIEFGCYPGSVEFLKKDIRRWGEYVRDSIVEPAIGRDLLQLHPIDQPALIRQIFGVAVSLPAQIISLQKLQGQLQGQGTLPTIQSYLEILSKGFLISGLQKFSKKSFRTRKSSPKLIVHDNALLRAFEKPIEKKISGENFGRYLENAIGSRFIEAGWDTYYWKDRDLEVDYIAVGPGGEKWAVEVKANKTNLGELKGLKKFCELDPDFEPILISLIDQQIEGIKTIHPENILEYSM